MAQNDLPGWAEVTSPDDREHGRRVFVQDTEAFVPAEIDILGVPNAIYFDEVWETHLQPVYVFNVPIAWRRAYVRRG